MRRVVAFNIAKTQLVLFDWSNNTGTIYVKMDASVVVEKSSFKMPGLTEGVGIDRNVARLSFFHSYYMVL